MTSVTPDLLHACRWALLVFLLSITACATNPEAPTTKSSGAILRYDTVHHPVVSNAGMVVSQNEIASQVGANILQQGGNAVDAAVAVGFALAVTLPRAGNIGGSGFLLMRKQDDPEVISIDFRSIAPGNIKLSDFRLADGSLDDQKMKYHPSASGIPGTVAGLYKAWEMAGSLPWRDLVKPAVRLAGEGFTVTPDLSFALGEAAQVMSGYAEDANPYLPQSEVPKAGDVLILKDLAWSLQQIADGGADAFYRGEVRDRLVAYSQSSGGHFSEEDFSSYRAQVRSAISTDFYGHEVWTMPPSSSGGITLLQILNTLQALEIANYPWGSAGSIHRIAETMKWTAANRRQEIGDPGFVEVPTAGMISKATGERIAQSIDPQQATPVEQIQAMSDYPEESKDTTHYSVADKYGNAVSVTYTLGYSFGSGVVVPGTGIILDNQIKNFYHNIEGHPNRMESGKRMISTMAPTIVLGPDKQTYMVTGSPGGGRIPNVISQVILNSVVYNKNIAEATHAPRIHQQWRTPNLGVEAGFSIDTASLLREYGHTIEEQATMCSTQSIVIKDGLFFGSADPRRPGAAAVGVNSFAPASN